MDSLAGSGGNGYTLACIMGRHHKTRLVLFAWLFTALLRSLRAVNWPVAAV